MSFQMVPASPPGPAAAPTATARQAKVANILQQLQSGGPLKLEPEQRSFIRSACEQNLAACQADVIACRAGLLANNNGRIPKVEQDVRLERDTVYYVRPNGTRQYWTRDKYQKFLEGSYQPILRPGPAQAELVRRRQAFQVERCLEQTRTGRRCVVRSSGRQS